MSGLVVDTGPIVAAVDRSDRAHRVAIALFGAWEGGDLLVADSVVAEVDMLLRARVAGDAARAFLTDVAEGAFRRVSPTRGLCERALEYDRRYAALDLGIVDATVMALAEAQRARVLSFDFRDFGATRPLRGGFWRLAIDEGRFRRLVG